MSRQILVELPDELYEQAEQWAVITSRNVGETLADALSLVLTPLPTDVADETPVSSLEDKELLTLAGTKLDAAVGERLSTLLAKQAEALLTAEEQGELMALMQHYQWLWIRQSEALAEAVERGLRPPLSR